MLKNPSNWSIGIHRGEVKLGDDFLMLMQGKGRRGIIAMGKITRIHGEDNFSLQPSSCAARRSARPHDLRKTSVAL